MKFLSNLTMSVVTAGIVLGLSYLYAPGLYAAVAYNIKILPITKSIIEAAPSREFTRRLDKIEDAGKLLQKSRVEIRETRRGIEDRIEDYKLRKVRSERLLDNARTVYRTNPNASVLKFIDKTYSRKHFGIQIDSINQQIIAQSESISTLEDSLVRLDKVWRDSAAREGQLAADSSALVAAKVLWQTEKLLSGLDTSIDFDGYDEVNRVTAQELRTVSELLRDAQIIIPLEASSDSKSGGLSDSAKVILMAN